LIQVSVNAVTVGRAKVDPEKRRRFYLFDNPTYRDSVVSDDAAISFELRGPSLPNSIFRLGPDPRRTRRHGKSEVRRYALLHHEGQVQGLVVAARRGCDDEIVASAGRANGISAARACSAASAAAAGA
jgi:hypothetical protein